MSKGQGLQKMFLCSVFFICTCICFNSCGLVAEEEMDSGSDSKKQNAEESSSLSGDGYYDAPEAVLNAEDIKETKWDYDVRETVEKILANQYKEEYDAMMSIISISATGEIKEGKKYYISKTPFYCWDAKRNRVSGSTATILVLSAEFRVIGFCDLVFERGKYQTCSYVEADSGYELMKNLEEKPQCKYLAIMNGYKTNLLDDENIFLYPNDNPVVKIQDDYYHAIDYEEIGVSYEELVNMKNLIEVTL